MSGTQVLCIHRKNARLEAMIIKSKVYAVCDAKSLFHCLDWYRRNNKMHNMHVYVSVSLNYGLVRQIQELPPLSAFSRHTLGIWLEGSTYHINPANFFRRKGMWFLSWYCGIAAWYPKIPDNLLKTYEDNPKDSEDPRSSSELSPRISFAKQNLLSFENWRGSVEELSFTCTFTIHFCFEYKLHVYITHIFESFARYGCNNSYFPKWREKLVRRCDWAWDQSFDLQAWDSRPRCESWQVYHIVENFRVQRSSGAIDLG